MNKKVIHFSEIYDIRNRKLKELDYYNQQLKELQIKMKFVRDEIDLTTSIITMIEDETVIDLKKAIKDDDSV